MSNQQLSTNTFGVAKWVVSPIASAGTHTTIQGAINAASAGDLIYIRTGTYTENITLKNGINLVGLLDSQDNGITILGKIIDNGITVICNIENLCLKTNGDNFISLTGTSSVIRIFNCFLWCNDATGMNTSDASQTISCTNCQGDTSTTGIGIYAGAGDYLFIFCQFHNTGGTTTASTTSLNHTFSYTYIGQPISTSGAGTVTFFNSHIDTSAQNATCVTTAGTGFVNSINTTFISGTASALSIGANTSCEFYKSTVNSANANAITGAGSFKSDAVTYTNSHGNNVTTRTFVILGENSTFTPALTFGGGNTGITYSGRSGSYTRIGNVVTFTLSVELSNKGSSTGAAVITGLPYAAATTTIISISANNLTFSGMVSARITSLDINLDQFASAGGRSQLTDTAFVNSTFVQISGSYLV